MQVFYEGPSWLADRRVLLYGPAFRGKTEEVVQEPDSVRRLSPGAFLEREDDQTTTSSYTTVSTEKGMFITDATGKTHLESVVGRQLARQREAAQRNRALNLLETRSDLVKTALTKVLNEAAADGWEVVQLSPYGTKGGLIYLLKHLYTQIFITVTVPSYSSRATFTCFRSSRLAAPRMAAYNASSDREARCNAL